MPAPLPRSIAEAARLIEAQSLSPVAIARLRERAAQDAGLRLAERELAILCGAAPHLIEMLARVRPAAGSAEPVSVFSFPQPG